MNARRLGARLLVATGVLLVVDQVLLHALLDDDLFLGNQVAPFDPPILSPAQEEKLQLIESSLATGVPAPKTLRFDPDLGWCNPRSGGFGEFRYDHAGARLGPTGPLPDEKLPGVRRVVAVGCSMTHGEEVAADEAWCARVDAALDDVEVANLGVAAYGLDQALLRLRRDGAPLAPDVVWLGLLPGAALRVTTLYRPLLRHWSRDVAIKPRFLLAEDGRLQLVENPARTLADVPRLLRDQRHFLAAFGAHDHWIRRARAAYLPRGSHWTHHSFVARIALSLHEAGGREIVPRYQDPEDEVYRLLLALILATRDEARALGAEFELLILPGEEDLALVEPDGRAYWDAFAADVAGRGVSVFDLTETLRAAPREGLFAPLGHYGPAGSARVAEALSARLLPASR